MSAILLNFVGTTISQIYLRKQTYKQKIFPNNVQTEQWGYDSLRTVGFNLRVQRRLLDDIGVSNSACDGLERSKAGEQLGQVRALYNIIWKKRAVS